MEKRREKNASPAARAIHTHIILKVTPSPNRGSIGFYCGGAIYIYICSQRGQPILECAQFKNQSLKKKKKSRQTFGGMFSSKSWSTYGAYVEDVSDRQRNLWTCSDCTVKSCFLSRSQTFHTTDIMMGLPFIRAMEPGIQAASGAKTRAETQFIEEAHSSGEVPKCTTLLSRLL